MVGEDTKVAHGAGKGERVGREHGVVDGEDGRHGSGQQSYPEENERRHPRWPLHFHWRTDRTNGLPGPFAQ